MMLNNKYVKLGAASVALFFSVWFLWNHYKPAPNTTQGNWNAPPPAVSIPEVVKAGPRKVVTLDKPQVSNKMNLPSVIKDDPQVDILATADVRTKDSRVAAVAYMNMSTGRTTIIAKEIPKPFLRFENTRELGVRYGYDHKLSQIGDVHGRWQFLGVGPAKLGLYGEINTKGEGKAMLDLSAEF